MTDLDDELANATDALLSGGELPTLSQANSNLGMVLRQLYDVIEPDEAPDATFTARLNQRLNTEWEQAHAPQLRLVDRPVFRLASLAAAVVLVLGALLVLAVPEGSQPLQGTAIGVDDAAALLVLLGVAAVGAFFYLRVRR